MGGQAGRALRDAMDETDPVEASLRFAGFLKSLQVAGFQEAAEELWATPGAQRDLNERKRLLSYRWGARDGVAAVEFANNQIGEGKVTALSAALSGWRRCQTG